MGKNEQLVLTSVKVHGDLFEGFKVASIKDKFNLESTPKKATEEDSLLN